MARLDLLPSGVFALCPYIAGNWPQDETDTGMLGTSHVENAEAPMEPLMQASHGRWGVNVTGKLGPKRPLIGISSQNLGSA
jgi:hypothetical protein